MVVDPATKLCPVVTPQAASPVILVKEAAEGMSSNLRALHLVLLAFAFKKTWPGKPVLRRFHVTLEEADVLLTENPLPVAPQNANKPQV
jgi:hypothetical protein